jgi:hypothetical protein
MIEEGRAWIASAGFRTLEVTYDSIVEGVGMDLVFEFLGLNEHRNAPSRSRRQSTRPWSDKVTNAPEIAAALISEGYGRFVA